MLWVHMKWINFPAIIAPCNCSSSSFCPAVQKCVRRSCAMLHTTVWPLTQIWAPGTSDLSAASLNKLYKSFIRAKYHNCQLIAAVYNKELYENIEMTLVFVLNPYVFLEYNIQLKESIKIKHTSWENNKVLLHTPKNLSAMGNHAALALFSQEIDAGKKIVYSFLLHLWATAMEYELCNYEITQPLGM